MPRRRERPGSPTKLQLSALSPFGQTPCIGSRSGVLAMAMTHRSRLAALGASLLLFAGLELSVHAQQAAGAALDAAIAGSHRSAANKARDRYRHPKETLEFFGLRPEMTVVEIWPGGGWYTEILAPVLRERGKLYAALYGAAPPFPYQSREMETFRAKLASAPAVYGSVTITALGFSERAHDRAGRVRRSRA